MKIYKPIISIGMIAICCQPLCAQAQEPKISISSRSQQEQPVIIVRSKYDFATTISLKMKADPSRGVSDVLIRAISKYGMVDALGVKITSGFDVDVPNNLVVAFSGGTSEIIKTTFSPNGFQVIGSFKDANGNFVSPPKDSLAVYNTNGEKLCFEYEDVTSANEIMYFALLLDRSWSMENHIDEVKATAKKFLNMLPDTAMCGVANFGHDWSYSHSEYKSCGATDFQIDDIALSGTTDIFAVLKPTYTNFARPFFNGRQKTVIIVTDGYTLDDEVRKQELTSIKGDVLTFVYFIGGTNRNALEGVTDHFITHEGDVAKSLSKYFETIGQAYKAQKILNVSTCQGGSYATP